MCRRFSEGLEDDNSAFWPYVVMMMMVMVNRLRCAKKCIHTAGLCLISGVKLFMT